MNLGFDVNRLNIKFEEDDLRKWIILINKQGMNYKHNIFITCFKDEETKEFSFKFQGQTFDDFILPTQTMKLIIDILNETMVNE